MASQRWSSVTMLTIATMAALLFIGSAEAWCKDGYKSCDDNHPNGCETRVASDHNHCGRCNNKCSYGDKCVDGYCKSHSRCKPGWKDCNKNGKCDVDCGKDRNHCGRCGNKCSHGDKCVDGYCKTYHSPCKPGWKDCNKNGKCDVDCGKDDNHCGGCNKKCEQPKYHGGESKCRDGKCMEKCKKGMKYDKYKKYCV